MLIFKSNFFLCFFFTLYKSSLKYNNKAEWWNQSKRTWFWRFSWAWLPTHSNLLKNSSLTLIRTRMQNSILMNSKPRHLHSAKISTTNNSKVCSKGAIPTEMGLSTRMNMLRILLAALISPQTQKVKALLVKLLMIRLKIWSRTLSCIKFKRSQQERQIKSRIKKENQMAKIRKLLNLPLL